MTSIALSGVDAVNFTLNLNGGADSCGSSNPTVIPGDSCTVLVGFVPSDFREYTAALVIQSNDPDTPTFSVNLDGTYAPVESITVKISQVEACLRENAKVYVSVVDQGGFSVTTLQGADFSLEEENVGVILKEVDIIENKTSLSVALVMDYSQSILWIDGAVADMEAAAKNFIAQMNGEDEAEIIKYAAEVKVMQEFTADPNLLDAAIERDPEFTGGSQIYDAVNIAIINLSKPERTKERKTVILLTDGREFESDATRKQIIDLANAQGISVYTVGFGEDQDQVMLQDLADQTGGLYYASDQSANLEEIYVKLADLVFQNQYILTYDSGIAVDSSGELVVRVDYEGIVGSDTRTIPICQ